MLHLEFYYGKTNTNINVISLIYDIFDKEYQKYYGNIFHIQKDYLKFIITITAAFNVTFYGIFNTGC